MDCTKNNFFANVTRAYLDCSPCQLMKGKKKISLILWEITLRLDNVLVKQQ